MNNVKLSNNDYTLNQIIDLRYDILRKPWNQPRETVTDNLENVSINAYIEIDGLVVACGRLQDNGNGIGQIRYMGISADFQRKGLGVLIIKKLEEEAEKLQIKTIELQARENAISFYESQHYVIKEKSFKLWDVIQHYLMTKQL